MVYTPFTVPSTCAFFASSLNKNVVKGSRNRPTFNHDHQTESPGAGHAGAGRRHHHPRPELRSGGRRRCRRGRLPDGHGGLRRIDDGSVVPCADPGAHLSADRQLRRAAGGRVRRARPAALVRVAEPHLDRRPGGGRTVRAAVALEAAPASVRLDEQARSARHLRCGHARADEANSGPRNGVG